MYICSHGMTHNEILSGHFTGMDVDEDGYLDSQELYKYISRNSSQPQIKTDKIRLIVNSNFRDCKGFIRIWDKT